MLQIMFTAQWQKTITSQPGNIEHSQTIMRLLIDLTVYEIELPQNFKNTVVRLGKYNIEHKRFIPYKA